MLPTSANGQPAAVGYNRDAAGEYRPYGVVVLSVTTEGVSQVRSFGDPRLVTVFGFGSPWYGVLAAERTMARPGDPLLRAEQRVERSVYPSPADCRKPAATVL
jgi:hypothetical protein